MDQVYRQYDYWFSLPKTPDVFSQVDLNEFMICCCAQGKLDWIQWIVSVRPDTIPEEQDTDHTQTMFQVSCGTGQLLLAQWLLQRVPSLDINVDDDAAFMEACSNGHLSVVRWLHTLGIDGRQVICSAYMSAANKGHLSVMRWLQTNTTHVEMTPEEWRILFCEVCVSGHLQVAQHIWTYLDDVLDEETLMGVFYDILDKYKPDSSLSIIEWLDDEHVAAEVVSGDTYAHIMHTACCFGRLEVVQWMYDCDPDHCVIDEDLLAITCINGHLEVAQWLYQVAAERLHIEAEDHDMFRHICECIECDLLEDAEAILDWLCTLNPLYSYTINRTRVPHNYRIVPHVRRPPLSIGLSITDMSLSCLIPMSCTSCPICMHEPQANLIKTACNHLFCELCITHWYEQGKNTCPTCRQPYVPLTRV